MLENFAKLSRDSEEFERAKHNGETHASRAESFRFIPWHHKLRGSKVGGDREAFSPPDVGDSAWLDSTDQYIS